jgi:hypothetical protein
MEVAMVVMSSLSGEQAVALQRASFEILSDVWTKAFDCIEKLTELNLRAVKSTLSENEVITSMALSAKDPRSYSHCTQSGRKPPWKKRGRTGGT